MWGIIWQDLGDLWYWYIWDIDRCGLGPDRWFESCN